MAFGAFPSNRLPAPLASAVNRFLQIDQLEKLYARASAKHGFVRRLLEDLQVTINIAASDLKKIPLSGPVVAVSNHPFGILDGVIMAHLLTGVRSDVRILTNQLLGELPELAPICFFIDPFDRPESRPANGRALKQAIRHLRAGGMLVVFPAGEVSHFNLKRRAICDAEWTT
jgi:putative hemolysin